MEVHPPEHGIHSWRDFFVHISTICLGLLVAIGLEQSVEALHRRHQQKELTERLKAESEFNLKAVEVDRPNVETKLEWHKQAMQATVDVIQSGKPGPSNFLSLISSRASTTP